MLFIVSVIGFCLSVYVSGCLYSECMYCVKSTDRLVGDDSLPPSINYRMSSSCSSLDRGGVEADHHNTTNQLVLLEESLERLVLLLLQHLLRLKY